MQGFKQLVYASIAIAPVDTSLLDIIRATEERNEGCGLSGMLQYGENAYLQLIEGPAKEVDALFAKIEADDRHRVLAVWARQSVTRAIGTGLPMGYAKTAITAKYLAKLDDETGPQAIDELTTSAYQNYPQAASRNN